MANRSHQKLRLLYLLRLFMEKTDDVNGLTTQQIVEELSYFGLDAERKAIYRDIRALRDFGLAIARRRGREWYLASRPFDLQELTTLVDAVQSAPFLTEEMTDQLIERIRLLASEAQRSALLRRIEVPGRVKMCNEDVLRNLDVIQRAMGLRRKVEFRYFHYDARKQRVLNRDGARYVVSPVRLIYAEEFYYLVAFMDEWAHEEGHQPFAPYRVDRMVDVRLSDEATTRDARIATYVTDEHVSPSFGMFAADKVAVTLELDERAMNPVIDRFGADALTFLDEGGRVRAHVRAPLSPQFFGWLVQLGPLVRIVSPRRAREQFLVLLEETRAQYVEKDGEEMGRGTEREVQGGVCTPEPTAGGGGTRHQRPPPRAGGARDGKDAAAES